MNTIVGIIIIILVIGYLGGSKTIYSNRIPYSIKLFAASGLTYLLFGIGLGKSGINLINEEVLSNLSPLLQLLLSWVGLIFGAQFKLSLVKKVPLKMYMGSMLQSIITFFTILLFTYIAVFYLDNIGGLDIALDSAIAIAAIGCVSSPTLLAIIIRQIKASGAIPRFLSFSASTDGLVGILIMSMFFAFYFNLNNSFLTFLYHLAISIFMGLVFILMARLPHNYNEKFVLLLGMLTFSGGVAYIIHFSPLFMNMIIGFILGNDTKCAAWIDRQLDIGERPFYLIMLLLLGAHFSMTDMPLSIILFPTAYIAAHAFGKQIGVPLGAVISGLKLKNYNFIGGGLYYQGGIAVAMALNFLMLSETTVIARDLVISSIVCGLIFNGLIAPNMIRKALNNCEVAEK